MGPLEGIRILEITGLGAAPFAGMMLADHGAEVLRVERPGAVFDPGDPLLRSRRAVTLDLKSADDLARLRALVAEADGLIEGFRPGVMERLGLGPDDLLGLNPKLVYGRVTGWGREGPFASAAGHDINYIALSGALDAYGREGQLPTPPANMVADFGGGGLLLAFGMLAALLAVRAGRPGQVVDCAMVDGAALLMSMIWGFRGTGRWPGPRGTNLLDTGAPYYDVYSTSDGGAVAVGAIEPHFYERLLRGLGLDDRDDLREQEDRSLWPDQKRILAERIGGMTMGELTPLFGTDACITPVLGLEDAAAHAHNRTRATFADVGGIIQASPSPRYSATPCGRSIPPAPPSTGGEARLTEWSVPE